MIHSPAYWAKIDLILDVEFFYIRPFPSTTSSFFVPIVWFVYIHYFIELYLFNRFEQILTAFISFQPTQFHRKIERSNAEIFFYHIQYEFLRLHEKKGS